MLPPSSPGEIGRAGISPMSHARLLLFSRIALVNDLCRYSIGRCADNFLFDVPLGLPISNVFGVACDLKIFPITCGRREAHVNSVCLRALRATRRSLAECEARQVARRDRRVRAFHRLAELPRFQLRLYVLGSAG